ncbi:MAG: FUSC family protein [Chitinophagaceae bacterium]|nr:FUSC family protein [Chitinophagaceae bacterium]
MTLFNIPTQWQQYRRFMHSFYFYEGMRLTVGIMLPVLLGIYFRHNSWGIAAAIGALAAGITDFPGPIHHRINGIVAVSFSVVGITLITGQLIHHPWALGVFIALAGFAFAIITVYGNRAAQIGTASLVILTLLVDETRVVHSYNELALVTLAGALMYLLLSLLLYRLRPYKLVQQVLGQCMQQTAEYLQIKARFYLPLPNYDELYQLLTETQVQINAAQQNVREIMFKTRSIIKESTHTSKVLLLAFLDLVDLFDSVMASQPNYRLMQTHLQTHPLLPRMHALLQRMATELNQTGQAFAEGNAYPPVPATAAALQELNTLFETARHEILDADLIDAFITLRHALDALEDVYHKLALLQQYSTYHKGIDLSRKVEYQRFVVPSYFSGRQVLNNISWQSNIFRYSIRMMAAMLAGYWLAQMLPLGHAYWVVLTIVVILKPAYAITRQRNIDRLLGTFIGVAIGAAILYSTTHTGILLSCMLVFMILSFSFWRHKYFISVLTLTVFIVLAMQLLNPGNFSLLLKDRLIDTVIGSAIAFVFTLLIPPVWEKLQIGALSRQTIHDNKRWFDYISMAFEGKQLHISEYKLFRKQLYVSLANFSDAFQRMTNEPKAMQQQAPYWQQLLVSNHTLASHLAALYNELQELQETEWLDDFLPITRQISNRLQTALSYLGEAGGEQQEGAATGMEEVAIRHEVNQLLQQRRRELERGEMETHTRGKLVALKSILDQLDMMLQLSGDIRRVSRKMAAG